MSTKQQNKTVQQKTTDNNNNMAEMIGKKRIGSLLTTTNFTTGNSSSSSSTPAQQLNEGQQQQQQFAEQERELQDSQQHEQSTNNNNNSSFNKSTTTNISKERRVSSDERNELLYTAPLDEEGGYDVGRWSLAEALQYGRETRNFRPAAAILKDTVLEFSDSLLSSGARRRFRAFSFCLLFALTILWLGAQEIVGLYDWSSYDWKKWTVAATNWKPD